MLQEYSIMCYYLVVIQQPVGQDQQDVYCHGIASPIRVIGG